MLDLGGVVSFTANGRCVVDANQAANTNYNATRLQQQSFAVVNGAVVGLGIVKVGGTGTPVVSCGTPAPATPAT